MELVLLYLWLKIDAIGLMFGIAGAFCFLGAFVSAMEKSTSYGDAGKLWGRRIKQFLISAPLLFVLATIIPSKTDIAILVGASVALDMAKSPEGVKVGTLLRGKVNEVLDDAIKGMAPKAAK